MTSSTQLLDAFSKAESRERIELMVIMCRLLTPTELRFMLTCLEDLAANSLRTYQKVEFEANDCKRLLSITRPEATLDEIVGQAVLFTSFLKKDNINGARLMTRILEEVMQRIELKDHLSNDRTSEKLDCKIPPIGDLLLLFSMASHHSAFSFSSRLRLHEYFMRLQELVNQPETRAESEQSTNGSSMFSSLESVETNEILHLSNEYGPSHETSSNTVKVAISSESVEDNSILNLESPKQSSEVNIPYHVVSSPKNTVAEPQVTKTSQLHPIQIVAMATVTSTSGRSDDVTRKSSCQQSNPADDARMEIREARRASSRMSCVEATSDKPIKQNDVVNVTNHAKDKKAVNCERPKELWSHPPTNEVAGSNCTNIHTHAEPTMSSFARPQVSAKSLLDKLISSNILNDVDVELAKEKRRSLGGNQKAHLVVSSISPTKASTPIRDIQTKVKSSVENLDDVVNDSCNVSQDEGELSQSILPDMIDFRDDTKSIRPASDRRSSMPPYLPSSLLPMFNGDEEEKGEHHRRENGNLSKTRTIESFTDLECHSTTVEYLKDKSESFIETVGSEANASISSRSYRSNFRTNFGHLRNINYPSMHRGVGDYQKNLMMNGGGGPSVPHDGGIGNRNHHLRSGRHELKPSRQNGFHANNNGNHILNRLQQHNSTFLPTQSKATFQPHYHQSFRTVHHLHLNQQSQQIQQQSKPSGSPPGAFNVQHLNIATSAAQTAQGYYTHYLYPAEFAHAIMNPTAYYTYRGLQTQTTIMNRTANGIAYNSKGLSNNIHLGVPLSVPRGVASSFYAQGSPLLMTAFQSNNGIQPLMCPEQVNVQAPQACFYDPSIPPPPINNAPTITTYAPQVVVLDQGLTADVNGKVMCPNCASSDHGFSHCPHSLPPLPR